MEYTKLREVLKLHNIDVGTKFNTRMAIAYLIDCISCVDWLVNESDLSSDKKRILKFVKDKLKDSSQTLQHVLNKHLSSEQVINKSVGDDCSKRVSVKQKDVDMLATFVLDGHEAVDITLQSEVETKPLDRF